MRIGFLTAKDPLDRRTWSGTPSFMAQALESAGAEVVPLGPITPHVHWAFKILNHVTRRLGTRVVSSAHSTTLAKAYARVVSRRLEGERIDVLFAPAGAALISYLETSLPIVYSSDATFALMADYYPEFSRLTRSSLRAGEIIERRAIHRAACCVYPSSWAADSAVGDYGASPARVHVAQYGANLETWPSTDQVEFHRDVTTCRLLFVGVNWERKGGRIAFETLESLRRRGVDASLTICGCTPPFDIAHDRLTVIPFLDKNDQRQREQLAQLYLDSDYFLLPTRQEAYGIVSCEAGAYGLPSITTATGGVPSVVEEGVNGFLLPLDATGDEYAGVIERLHRDPAAYVDCSRAARGAFEGRLNWPVWGHAVVDMMRDVLVSNAIGGSRAASN